MNCVAPVYADLGPAQGSWEGYGEYVAHFDYSPGRPGVHTLRNGDPGYPDDPAELCLTALERGGVIKEVYDADGMALLTDEQIEQIEAQLWERIAEQNVEDDADEYRYWVARAEDV